ncbi:hypothetical protein PspLS_02749 [Pyricularia sp. CBS 133598]|nr:hypothetical protein PspLS_02749 [Pyricularia sp. CBS 133598]
MAGSVQPLVQIANQCGLPPWVALKSNRDSRLIGQYACTYTTLPDVVQVKRTGATCRCRETRRDRLHNSLVNFPHEVR